MRYSLVNALLPDWGEIQPGTKVIVAGLIRAEMKVLIEVTACKG